MVTEAQWLKMAERSESLFQHIELKCDGYPITIRLERASITANRFVIYVDGQIKGEWFVSENDIANRFFPERKSYVWSSEERKRAIEQLGKRRAESLGFLKVYTYRGVYWKSFRSLKRHLIKNNETIEWLNE